MLQFTEEFDFNSSSNRRLIIAQVKHHIQAHSVESVLVWVSLPCTGGTPWTYINLRHPTGNRKVKQHRRKFAVLWTSLVEFLSALPGVHVAIEWPRGCTYWGLPKVRKLIDKLCLAPYHFDGCAVGLKGIRIIFP